MNIQTIVSNGLTALICLLHVYILILEMFWWTKPRGLRAFGQSHADALRSQTLAANQGLYNGFLAAGLAWSLIHPRPEFGFELKIFFLSCVLVAGLYGGATVSRKILKVQALPAALALLATLIPFGG